MLSNGQRKKRRRRAPKKFLNDDDDDDNDGECDREERSEYRYPKRNMFKRDDDEVIKVFSWNYDTDSDDTDYYVDHYHYTSCDEENKPKALKNEVKLIKLGVNPIYEKLEMDYSNPFMYVYDEDLFRNQMLAASLELDEYEYDSNDTEAWNQIDLIKFICSLFENSDDKNNESTKNEENKQSTIKIFNSRLNEISSCVGCNWSNPRFDKMQENSINMCIRIIEQRYGTMHNLVLAKNVHEIFKTNVLPYQLEKGIDMPMWTTRSIYKHITEHSLEPRIYVGETIHELKRRKRKLKKKTKVKQELTNGDTRTVIDKNTNKSILDIEKEIRALYNVDTKGMNFYNKECSIDFGLLGKHIRVK